MESQSLSPQQLRWKAAKGLIGMLAFSAILLFALSDTFDYWQGWTFLMLFTVISVVISVYFLQTSPELVERRLSAGPTAEHQRSQKIIQGVASVLFVATMAVPALDRRFQWSYVPAALSIFADVLFVIGYLIMAWVMRANVFAASTIQV